MHEWMSTRWVGWAVRHLRGLARAPYAGPLAQIIDTAPLPASPLYITSAPPPPPPSLTARRARAATVPAAPRGRGILRTAAGAPAWAAQSRPAAVGLQLPAPPRVHCVPPPPPRRQRCRRWRWHGLWRGRPPLACGLPARPATAAGRCAAVRGRPGQLQRRRSCRLARRLGAPGAGRQSSSDALVTHGKRDGPPMLCQTCDRPSNRRLPDPPPPLPTD